MSDRTSRLRCRIIATLVLLLLVGGAAAGFSFFRVKATPSPQAATPPVVELSSSEVTVVVPRDLRRTVPVSGTLRPVDQSEVKAEVAAKVKEVLVREGEAVKRGQVLARLDPIDLQNKLNEKIANLEASKAQLAWAEKDHNTKQTLRERDIASQAALDQVNATWRANQAAVAAWQAQVEIARKALADAVITAPIDGFVAERLVNPGETTKIDNKLFTLVDLTQIEIAAPVPAPDIPTVAVGQETLLRIEGFGDRVFKGTVERINPVAPSGSHAIPVYIRLANGDGRLRGGMFASGEVVTFRQDAALALPSAAVRRDAQGDYAIVIENGRAERRPVTVGARASDDLVEIRDGVRPGDRVLTAPLTLQPGLAVRLAGS